TAYWDAERQSINHYKRRFYFQFWGRPDFDAHTCGEHTLKGLQGSWVDAEDGELQGGDISHGAADSCAQWNLALAANETKTIHLLVMIGRSRHDVNEFHRRLLPLDPQLLADEASRFWGNWIANKRLRVDNGLSERAKTLYRRSVFVLNDCASENGAIVASPDPRTLKSGGDNYNYCWWRDGSYISKAMDECGLRQNAERFLRFAAECQQDEGYFLHRHFPDGTVGSTWHPPPFIQVDQTASVISAVWHHHKHEADLDKLLGFWPLVRRSADFLMNFVTPQGLPRPSYDLWEERKSINTYSVAAVLHGLRRAVRIGQDLGKRTAFWETAEQRMRDAALNTLWDPRRSVFYKSIEPLDETLDASSLLALKLGLLAPSDPRAQPFVDAVEKRLWSPKAGGMARYEGDRYYGQENPWIICTLWLAEAHLLLGRPERCRDLIEWAAATAGPTGLLSEQLDAATGQPTSVTPLVWSHSTFLDTVNKFTRYQADARARNR
ncbi:MAG TPA: glycoside hydrolase family 15 protein, partial [Candidatus Thermoplasmatota archaeon]|nr:glycoside hydrolase family 15 protein [Candidatus Thermoplasmatota archaeon]